MYNALEFVAWFPTFVSFKPHNSILVFSISCVYFAIEQNISAKHALEVNILSCNSYLETTFKDSGSKLNFNNENVYNLKMGAQVQF